MKQKAVLAVLTLILVLLMPVSLYSQDGKPGGGFEFSARAGFDFGGSFEIEDGGGEGDVETGITIGLEALFPIDPFKLGLGVSFLIPRGIDEEGATGTVGLLPVYAVLNFPIPLSESKVLPYLFGRIGYSFVYDDSAISDPIKAMGIDDVKIEGGVYWGIGMGLQLVNNIKLEFNYASHSVTASSDDYDVSTDATYTYLNFSVGYKF